MCGGLFSFFSSLEGRAWVSPARDWRLGDLRVLRVVCINGSPEGPEWIFNRPFEPSHSAFRRLLEGREGGAWSWVAVRLMLSKMGEKYDLGIQKGFLQMVPAKAQLSNAPSPFLRPRWLPAVPVDHSSTPNFPVQPWRQCLAFFQSQTGPASLAPDPQCLQVSRAGPRILGDYGLLPSELVLASLVRTQEKESQVPNPRRATRRERIPAVSVLRQDQYARGRRSQPPG